MFEPGIVILLAIFTFVGGFGFGINYGMNLAGKASKEELEKAIREVRNEKTRGL